MTRCLAAIAPCSHSEGTQEEVFKDIPGYEGLYQVTSNSKIYSVPREYTTGEYGAVINTGGKYLKPRINPQGYLVVNLSKGGRLTTFVVHRLVAKAFIPNPNNLPEINHKDGVKANNAISNLEWISRIDNVRHAFHVLKVTRPVPEISTERKTLLQKIVAIKPSLKRGDQIRIAKSIAMHPSTLSAMINGKQYCVEYLAAAYAALTRYTQQDNTIHTLQR